MTRTLTPGDRVSEYVLEEKVGEGGFGEVWRARHHVLDDRTVAVKIPTDPSFVEHLRSEGLVQHRVGGEHVLRCLGLDPFADPPYLVTEYVDGRDLRTLLAEEGHLPWREAVAVTADVARALAGAHEQGVVHGDVKPENVLVDGDGRAYLIDFGIGRTQSTFSELALSGTFESGTVAGTIPYLSPEQRTPGATVDPRSDIYALGILLFETVCGRRPEGVEVPSEVRPVVPEELDEVFRRAYAPLDRRYSDVGRLLRDLDALDDGRPLSPEAPPRRYDSPDREPEVPPRRYRTTSSPSGGSILAFVLAIILGVSCLWPLGFIPFLIGRQEVQAVQRGDRSEASLPFARWGQALGLVQFLVVPIGLCFLVALASL